MSKEKEVKILVIESGQYPYIISDFKNELSEYQKMVGGLISCVDLFDGTTTVCNDEGKLMGLPLNRSIRNDEGKLIDIFAGTLVFVGVDYATGEFKSLTDEQIQEIKDVYYNPEIFFMHNGEIHAVDIGVQINLLDNNEIALTSSKTGEVMDLLKCSNDKEQLKMGMAINRMRSEVLRSMDFGYSDLNLSAETILNVAIDPFSDVWDEGR